MNPAAVKAIVVLIQNILVGFEALKAISVLIQERQARGEDVTLDDLKSLELNDDIARDHLLSAIDEAERG